MGRDRDITADLSAVFADRIRLPTGIEQLRASYTESAPFPHVVIDNLFAPHILDPLLDEMAQMQDSQWLLVESQPHERIRRMRSAVDLGPAGAQMVSLVHSAQFLYLLSEITGIWQLLPDPYLQGAGYAQMRRGDFFKVHSDRNVAYDTGLSRRLAMIVFLNKAWDPGYNGQLELWNDEATQCNVSVEPAFNRTILFEVADPNYHGVPAPIACPEDRSRQSFIVYYHTVGTDGKSARTPRTSTFAPSFYREDPRFRSFARQVTPPVLFKAARRLARFCFPALRRS
jgi:Rps23 Pro-64 3,4-dihydroxylase Tpa1-like proline 4-hydroxylase